MKKLLLFILLSPLSLFATNYYISTTGNNTNNGLSTTTSKATLANVFSTYNLGAGDIIYVAAGTYAEKNITIGSDDEGFTIQGAELDASGQPTTIFDSDQSTLWLNFGYDNNDNITIDKIKVKDYRNNTTAPNGGGICIYTKDCIGLTVSNCYFDNCDANKGGAIFFSLGSGGSANSFNLSNTTFTNCDAPGNGGGLYIESSSEVDLNISKCKFFNNTSTAAAGSALYYNGPSGSVLTMTNCLVYKNTLGGNNHGSVYIGPAGCIANLMNCTIADNTQSSGGTYTGGVYFEAGGSTVTNCILYGNTYKDVYRAAGTINLNYCCYQNHQGCTITNSITTDPRFNNKTNNDYSLKHSSPCIDNATSSGASGDDILSVVRPMGAGIDIGAYESNPCSFTLSSANGTANQTVCINSAITNVVYKVRTATTASVTGLPTGLSGSYVMSGDTLIYTISGTPTQSGPFTYTITSGGGCVASVDGVITVNDPPVISVQPTSGNICVGGTFSPSITVTGGTTLTYQWKYATSSGGTYNNVVNGTPANSTYTNATTNTLSVTGNIAAGSGYYYKCVVSDAGSGCSSVTSDFAQLTVNADPSITTQPTAGTICVGGTYSPTVVASGGTAKTYQWQFSTSSGGTYNNVVNGTPANSTYTNATTNTLSVTGNIAAGSAYYYKCIVSDAGSGCGAVTSSSAQLTVNAVPSITTQPTAGNICYGGTYSPSITATGGVTKSYQWQFSTDNATWGNVTNGTPANATFINGTTTTLSQSGNVAAGSAYYYRCIVSDASSGCSSVTSSSSQLTINAVPAISVQPSTGNICVGGTFSPSITATGGTNLTYQWKYSSVAGGGGAYANVVNGQPAGSTYTNATTNTLTVTGISSSSTYYYKCVVSDAGSGCSSVTSDFAQLTVNADPSITTQPTAGTICVGGTYSPTIVASGGTAKTYQWQFSTTSGGVYANVVDGTPANSTYTNVTTNTLSVTGNIVAGSAYYYKCVVSDAGSGCGSVTSSSAQLTVNAVPSITTQPTAGSICFGGTYSPTIIASGGTSKTYQWQFSTDNATWGNVTNGTPANATFANGATTTLTQTGNVAVGSNYYYRCVVSSTGSYVCKIDIFKK